ncbi:MULTISPECIES: NAD(P)/FAD-dependent oxidoreductase [Pontibacillus]|uniref:FAD-binding oxidoreductase n=1 Tax=Pontibacillus chungwhensis TaxID=265426 RepID=A0ABY8UUH8_9BACI|nr:MULTISPECIES: FAD-binding oxidoreductase [Pontibacillus]MCD5325071.1 FAD-binding oxidoreductase [Pontibacillus sp. HN14]WIF97322.1 FAD-binding oxidoreductase [Pontibacillus chungwhensis]
MKSYIVVGSGILGASTAYHLAKQGARVTLVDRQDSGQATDAAAGMVCPWLSQRRNKAWYQLVKNGARYYPELVRDLEQDGQSDTGYKRVGALKLHTEEAKLDKIVTLAKKRREDAPEIGEITKLSREETKSMFPPLSDEYGAVYVSGGARVDGRALRNALVKAAEKRGARIQYGDATLSYEGATVTGVTVNDEFLSGEKVMVTGGAWSKEMLEPLGVRFLVSSQKAQIAHVGLPVKETGDWPVVMPPTNKYILPFDQGRIVMGATHEENEDFNDQVTAGGLHDIFSQVLPIAPGLKEGVFVESRVGFRPYTPGFLPVIGAVPGVNNLLVANGLGASGLTSGPYLGFELANLALGYSSGIDLTPYDVSGAIE